MQLNPTAPLVTNMSSTATAVPIDPKIAHPLGRLRGIIRRYVTVEGALALALFVAAWFWLAMLIDYGVFKVFAFDWALETPKALRGIALGLAVAGLLALLVTKIVMRLTREFSNSSLALVLEKRYPKILGDRLITAVELADLEKAREYGYSVAMIKKTVDDVRAKMDQVPVNEVFNWRRLWKQGAAFVGLSAGFFLLTGLGFCAITGAGPKAFYHDFTDVSAMLVERDVMLRNVPWPRRAYLEIVDFPGDEMRIGRDAPSPKVKVAAYQWVIADASAPVGWRPLTWADLPKVLPGESVPKLPLQPIRDARYSVDLGPMVYGSAHPFTAPTLPADVTSVPDDPAAWTVDRVEQVFQLDADVRKMLPAQFETDLNAIGTTFEKLTSRAAEPAMSRTMRKLKIPDEVTLYYKGAKTRVDMKLRAEANNEFTGTLTDLKESVKFTARGENYSTPEKLITLVPPPMLQELKRDEYHPAYLYHKAPFADDKDLSPEQKPYLADPIKLKGVRHILRDQAVSLTGDKSRFDIPMGTEFVLKGRSDKPLVEAKLLPKAGKFPGIEADVQDPDPIDLPIVDGHAIQFEFNAVKKTMVTRQTEFDIYLKDTDGVTSKRPVQIVVEEDRVPEVDVVVDVIRKVGSTYICTPQALIPFTKESKIRDDRGLNRVEFVFGYSEIEPMAVTVKRAELAMWFFNGAPIFPTLGDPLTKFASIQQNILRVRPAPEASVAEQRSPIPAFAEQFTKRMSALAEIKGRLDGPRPVGSEETVEKLVDFRGIEDELKLLPEAEVHYGFDLRKLAAGLKRASENEAQRNYLLTLNVVAIDTNVEAAKPGVGQNKEVLVFKLVGDGELLTEIAREEGGLAEKLDDAIRRTADVDNKLRSLAARLPSNMTPEQFLADQTRSNELVEQLGKAKDITGEVGTDYSRILQEFRVNRLPQHLITQMEKRIVDKLREVITADFPQTEEAYGRFHSELAQAHAPAAEVVFTAQQKVTVLLAKLREIRSGIGEGLDQKKLISQLENLIRDERSVQAGIDGWGEALKGNLRFVLSFPPNAPLTIQAGQKTTVRLPIEIGVLYNGKFTMKAEASPGSELKVNAEFKFKDEDKDISVDIEAGQAKGNFWVRMTPDIGPAKDIRVIVK